MPSSGAKRTGIVSGAEIAHLNADGSPEVDDRIVD